MLPCSAGVWFRTALGQKAISAGDGIASALPRQPLTGPAGRYAHARRRLRGSPPIVFKFEPANTNAPRLMRGCTNLMHECHQQSDTDRSMVLPLRTKRLAGYNFNVFRKRCLNEWRCPSDV